MLSMVDKKPAVVKDEGLAVKQEGPALQATTNERLFLLQKLAKERKYVDHGHQLDEKPDPDHKDNRLFPID